MPTLLEKAKQVKRKYSRSSIIRNPEILDLVFAYMNKEITGLQAMAALGMKNRNVSSTLGNYVITAARHGLVEIRRVKK